MALGISSTEMLLVLPDADNVQSGISSSSSSDVSEPDTLDLEDKVGRLREGLVTGDESPIREPVTCSIILLLAESCILLCSFCCSSLILFSSVCIILLMYAVSNSNTPPIASLFDGFDLFGNTGSPSGVSELTILFISSFGHRSNFPVVKISSLLFTLFGSDKEYLFPNIFDNV